MKLFLLSRRRCAICFGLNFDSSEKAGQVAHLDHNSSNSKLQNLVYLCLEHHDQYDSTTSQSKGLTQGEVKRYRTDLYKFVKELKTTWLDSPQQESRFDETKRPKLTTEVYDRKISAYRTIRDFLQAVGTKGTVTLEELSKFSADTDEFLFLFDKEIADYLRELYKKAVTLYVTYNKLASEHLPASEDRSKLADEDFKLLVWFSEQFEIARARFYAHIGL